MNTPTFTLLNIIFFVTAGRKTFVLWGLTDDYFLTILEKNKRAVRYPSAHPSIFHWLQH